MKTSFGATLALSRFGFGVAWFGWISPRTIAGNDEGHSQREKHTKQAGSSV